MEFFKFTGKNKALIMAENEEEAIEIFEFRISDFNEDEIITKIGETSAQVIVWEADIDFDEYQRIRLAIQEKKESAVLHVDGKIQ